MGCKDTFRVVGEDGQDYEVDADIVTEPPRSLPATLPRPNPDQDFESDLEIIAKAEQLTSSDVFSEQDRDRIKAFSALVVDQGGRYLGRKGGDLFPGAKGFHKRSYSPTRFSTYVGKTKQQLFSSGSATALVTDIEQALDRISLQVEEGQAATPGGIEAAFVTRAPLRSVFPFSTSEYVAFDLVANRGNDFSSSDQQFIMSVRLDKETCEQIVALANL